MKPALGYLAAVMVMVMHSRPKPWLFGCGQTPTIRSSSGFNVTRAPLCDRSDNRISTKR